MIDVVHRLEQIDCSNVVYLFFYVDFCCEKHCKVKKNMYLCIPVREPLCVVAVGQ